MAITFTTANLYSLYGGWGYVASDSYGNFDVANNISSLITSEYHYYYVDNKYLYKYDIATKTLIILRYIPTTFPTGISPTLYIDNANRIYAYSNLIDEYSYLLYDPTNAYNVNQDTYVDIPSPQRYMMQDTALVIDNNYVVDLDSKTRIVNYVLQDTQISIPQATIYEQQDTVVDIIPSTNVAFDQDLLINIQSVYNLQQDTLFETTIRPVLYWEQIQLDTYNVFNTNNKSYIKEVDGDLYTLNNISFNDNNESFLSLLKFDLVNNTFHICYLGRDFFNYINLFSNTDIYTNFAFDITIVSQTKYLVVEAPYDSTIFFVFVINDNYLSYLKTIQTSNDSGGVFYIQDSTMYFNDGYYVDFLTNEKGTYTNNYNNLIYNDQTYFIDDFNSQIITYKKENTDRYITVIPGGEGGQEFSLYIDTNGDLIGLGNNSYGQLGLGSSSFIDVWTNTGMNNIKAVYTNAYNTFVLKNDGTMWGTGYNGAGILGLGDTTDRTTFTQLPSGFNNPKKFVTNGFHAFVEKQDGTVWAVGHNGDGRLGLGDTNNRTVLTQLPSEFDNPIAISCGQFHSILIKQDGTVWATGDNYYGQLGLGDTNDRYVFTQTSLTVSNFKSIDCGERFTIIVDGDNVYSSGDNYYGQLGVGDTTNRTSFAQATTLTGISKVECGSEFTTLFMTDGTLNVAGRNYEYMTGYLSSTSNILSFINVVLPFQCKYVKPNSYLTIYVDDSDNVYYTGESTNGFGYYNDGYSGANYKAVTDITIAPLSLGGVSISNLGNYTYNTLYSFLEFNGNMYFYFDKQYLYKLDTTNDTFIQVLDLLTTYDNGLNPILYAQQSGFIYSYLNYNNLNNYLLSDENGNASIFNLQDTIHDIPEAQRFFEQDSQALINNNLVSDIDTLIDLKNYTLQDTSVDIPSPVRIYNQDTIHTISVSANFPQDMLVDISTQQTFEQDSFFMSVGLYSQYQDTFFESSIHTDVNIRNSFLLEDNALFINNLIISLIYILNNDFRDKYELRYDILNKFLLNNPMNALVYLKNSLIVSKSYVLNNNILDYYNKAINVLNELIGAYEKNYEINNDILDKLDYVFYLVNEIKDKYELPIVLRNKLNDKLVDFLLINNNIEKYLNKDIEINNILEENILGEINTSNYNIYISE